MRPHKRLIATALLVLHVHAASAASLGEWRVDADGCNPEIQQQMTKAREDRSETATRYAFTEIGDPMLASSEKFSGCFKLLEMIDRIANAAYSFPSFNLASNFGMVMNQVLQQIITNAAEAAIRRACDTVLNEVVQQKTPFDKLDGSVQMAGNQLRKLPDELEALVISRVRSRLQNIPSNDWVATSLRTPAYGAAAPRAVDNGWWDRVTNRLRQKLGTEPNVAGPQ